MIHQTIRSSQLNARRFNRGFSLLELLVVIGLIAGLSVFIVGGLGSGSKSASLQSAQATVANMIAATRMKAMASGQAVRFLVNVDANSAALPARYLRYLAIQVQVGGVWTPVADAYLPEGVYVMPGNFAVIPAGLFATNTYFLRSDGVNLRSTAFQNGNITAETINSAIVEQWVNLSIAAPGTTGTAGDIVLVYGRALAPGAFAAGASPVVFENPEEVRGLTLSSYGVASLINSRASF